LKASVIVTLPFALFHLPSLMVDQVISLAQFPLALGFLGIFAILQLLGRVVIMWLYNNTNRSVLLVGMFHSSYDVTTQSFSAFIPGGTGSGFVPATIAVTVAAVLIVVFTRGRLSYKPILASPSEEAPHPPDAPLTQA